MVREPDPHAAEPAPLAPPHRRLALALAGVALFLVPWTIYLTATLPQRHTTYHYDVAWVGFDVGLVAAVTATAVSLVVRPGWVPVIASITGALFLCDAWFDIVTSHTGGAMARALGEAGGGELPVAALCFWLAADTERRIVRAVSGAVRGRRAGAGVS